MAHDIFISYSSKDKPVADAICATLEKRQVRCWIAPRDILPGTDYSAAIVGAIQDCRAIILVFSTNANNSKHIRLEVEQGVRNGKFILPFRIEDVPPIKSLDYFLSDKHWLDALTPPLEAHISKLADSVFRLLDFPGKPTFFPVPPGPDTVQRRLPNFAATLLLGLVVALCTGVAIYEFFAPTEAGLQWRKAGALLIPFLLLLIIGCWKEGLFVGYYPRVREPVFKEKFLIMVFSALLIFGTVLFFPFTVRKTYEWSYHPISGAGYRLGLAAGFNRHDFFFLKPEFASVYDLKLTLRVYPVAASSEALADKSTPSVITVTLPSLRSEYTPRANPQKRISRVLDFEVLIAWLHDEVGLNTTLPQIQNGATDIIQLLKFYETQTPQSPNEFANLAKPTLKDFVYDPQDKGESRPLPTVSSFVLFMFIITSLSAVHLAGPKLVARPKSTPQKPASLSHQF